MTHFGYKFTDKHKENLRLAKIGKINSATLPEVRLKISRNRKLVGNKSGSSASNWRGGITKIDKLCRALSEYKNWRSDIFKRDGWKCKTCGAFGVYVTAHHIKGFSKILKENKITNIIDAKSCIELWDRNNGITLCEPCHSLTDNYRGRAKNI